MMVNYENMMFCNSGGGAGGGGGGASKGGGGGGAKSVMNALKEKGIQLSTAAKEFISSALTPNAKWNPNKPGRPPDGGRELRNLKTGIPRTQGFKGMLRNNITGKFAGAFKPPSITGQYRDKLRGQLQTAASTSKSASGFMKKATNLINNAIFNSGLSGRRKTVG